MTLTEGPADRGIYQTMTDSQYIYSLYLWILHRTYSGISIWGFVGISHWMKLGKAAKSKR